MRSAVGIPVLPAQAVAKAKGGEDVNAESRHTDTPDQQAALRNGRLRSHIDARQAWAH